MSIAAVPHYLGQDFRNTSPGMRFGMYLPIWTERADQERQIHKMARARSRQGQVLQEILENQGMDSAISHVKRSRGRFPELWHKNDQAANKAWDDVAKLRKDDRNCVAALVERQSAIAAVLGDTTVLALYAQSTAPFTTGLGNEHPLENGFAFLWPYGLPYLPGSGVKGVVRQAARELASGEWGDDTQGWNSDKRHSMKSGKTTIKLSDLDLLFGLESTNDGKEHFRGLLTFWDVIPEITGDLAVDVMTPHQKHYHQESQPPHDSGQPVPITFLTVPAGSTFPFHVTRDTERMGRIASHLLEQEGHAALATSAHRRLRARFRLAGLWRQDSRGLWRDGIDQYLQDPSGSPPTGNLGTDPGHLHTEQPGTDRNQRGFDGSAPKGIRQGSARWLIKDHTGKTLVLHKFPS